MSLLLCKTPIQYRMTEACTRCLRRPLQASKHLSSYIYALECHEMSRFISDVGFLLRGNCLTNEGHMQHETKVIAFCWLTLALNPSLNLNPNLDFNPNPTLNLSPDPHPLSISQDHQWQFSTLSGTLWPQHQNCQHIGFFVLSDRSDMVYVRPFCAETSV